MTASFSEPFALLLPAGEGERLKLHWLIRQQVCDKPNQRTARVKIRTRNRMKYWDRCHSRPFRLTNSAYESQYRRYLIILQLDLSENYPTFRRLSYCTVIIHAHSVDRIFPSSLCVPRRLLRVDNGWSTRGFHRFCMPWELQNVRALRSQRKKGGTFLSLSCHTFFTRHVQFPQTRVCRPSHRFTASISQYARNCYYPFLENSVIAQNSTRNIYTKQNKNKVKFLFIAMRRD